LDGKKYSGKRIDIQCKMNFKTFINYYFRISKVMLKIGILMNALYLKCGKNKKILNSINKRNYFRKCLLKICKMFLRFFSEE
jgi:hypothetical protein